MAHGASGVRIPSAAPSKPLSLIDKPVPTMKVLAFNTSPRKQQGTTDIILDYFLNGASEAGATVKKYYVTELDIQGCIGCFKCWTETPGRCIYRDDMDKIISEYLNADMIVFGTPIYNENITHYLQRMMERMLPLLLPWMEERQGIIYHPLRYRSKHQKIVLIAVSGFPDQRTFHHVRNLFPNALHILLPFGEMLRDPEGKELVKDFIEAVPVAARQLIKRGEVDQDIK